MTIYPTVLYIKQHSITGLKYFGKTTRDPYTYNGSGKHWKAHIKKHGTEHIETLWVSEPFIDSGLISEFALTFSKEHNIVESKDWANLIEENGLDGANKGSTHSDESKRKMSASHIGKPQSEETKRKKSESTKGRSGKSHSEETKQKLSNKPISEETKRKMSDAQTGKTRSEETKRKISNATSLRWLKIKSQQSAQVLP